MILAGWVNLVSAADWPGVLKQVKSMQARFKVEIKDMVWIQDARMTGSNGEMIHEMKLFRKGDKYRWESKMQGPQMPGGMETVIIYDGRDTWMVSGFTGKKKLSGGQEKQYQAQRDWWDQVSEKASIVGSETVSGRDCYVVDVNDPQKSSFTKMWVDKKSLNLIKGEMKNPKGETSSWVSSDFRKVKGDLEMPYKTEMFQNGKLMSAAVVKSVEINKGLADDLFDPEKVQVKGFDFQKMMKGMPMPPPGSGEEKKGEE
jgi:outer membrane lipoprotein-sorting protein